MNPTEPLEQGRLILHRFRWNLKCALDQEPDQHAEILLAWLYASPCQDMHAEVERMAICLALARRRVGAARRSNPP